MKNLSLLTDEKSLILKLVVYDWIKKKKRLIVSENLADASEDIKIANYIQKSLCRKIPISRTSR